MKNHYSKLNVNMTIIFAFFGTESKRYLYIKITLLHQLLFFPTTPKSQPTKSSPNKNLSSIFYTSPLKPIHTQKKKKSFTTSSGLQAWRSRSWKLSFVCFLFFIILLISLFLFPFCIWAHFIYVFFPEIKN